MSPVARPTLTPRGEEKVFYDRLRDHELVFQRCRGCSRVVFPLRTVCPFCGDEDPAVKTASGRGTVHSFTEQHRAAHPSFADDLPLTLALADMEEGFRVLGSVPDADGIRVGSPIEVVFDDVDPELTLVRFRLTSAEEMSS